MDCGEHVFTRQHGTLAERGVGLEIYQAGESAAERTRIVSLLSRPGL